MINYKIIKIIKKNEFLNIYCLFKKPKSNKMPRALSKKRAKIAKIAEIAKEEEEEENLLISEKEKFINSLEYIFTLEDVDYVIIKLRSLMKDIVRKKEIIDFYEPRSSLPKEIIKNRKRLLDEMISLTKDKIFEVETKSAICGICGVKAFKPVNFYTKTKTGGSWREKCNKPKSCLDCTRAYIKNIVESHLCDDKKYVDVGTIKIVCPYGCCRENRSIPLCSVANYEVIDFSNCYTPNPLFKRNDCIWRELYTSKKLNMSCSKCGKRCESFDIFREHLCNKDAYNDIFKKLLNEDIKTHVSRFIEQPVDVVIPKTLSYRIKDKIIKDAYISSHMILVRI